MKAKATIELPTEITKDFVVLGLSKELESSKRAVARLTTRIQNLKAVIEEMKTRDKNVKTFLVEVRDAALNYIPDYGSQLFGN